MLLVKTNVAPSLIHGIGLFAAEEIRAGQVIWEYLDGFDRYFHVSSLDGKSEAFKEFFNRYAAKDGYYFQLDCDNTRFMNHSSTPNVSTGRGSEGMVASVDIHIGDEITCNYAEFDEGGVI